MLEALPSVFVNITAWMIRPNRTASGDAPTDEIAASVALPQPRAPRSNQPTLPKLRTSLTTLASHLSVPRTSAVGLQSQRPPHAACAQQEFWTIPEPKYSGSLHCVSGPVLSPLPCDGKARNNCPMYNVLLCLSLDGDVMSS